MPLDFDLPIDPASVPLLDGHAHLLLPDARAARGCGLFDMLQYIRSDMNAAGVPYDRLERIAAARDFDALHDAYARVAHTGYGRAFALFARDLYGIPPSDAAHLRALHRAIERNSRPDRVVAWYDEVLGRRAGIEHALSIYEGALDASGRILPVAYLDFWMRRDHIRAFQTRDPSRASADDFLAYMGEWLNRMRALGVRAGKFALPYWRDPRMMPSEAVDESAARREYAGDAPRNPQWEAFVFHRLMRWLEQNDLPVQFHTGHVEPRSADMRAYDPEWSRISGFSRLARAYPGVRMVLLHAGFPYTGEYLSIVKSAPNLYADFSWVYLIAPTAARQALHMALDMVPHGKIIGFGGDCEQVEMTYAHAVIARRAIVDVLAERVRAGSLDADGARDVLHALAYGNAKEIYGL